MIQLNTKYEIGEEVYTIVKKNSTIPCPMCNANKVITYNDVTVKCPNCYGVGEIATNKIMWLVLDVVQTISTIKVNISKNENTVEYKLCPKSRYGSILIRCENDIFKTKAHAEQECNKRNEVRTNIKVSDIKITRAFSDGIPAPEKIAKRVREYKECGKFNTTIIVSKDGYLLDGYSAYLVGKMLGIDTLNVSVR